MLVRIKWTLSHVNWQCTIDIANNITLDEIKKLALTKVGQYGDHVSKFSIEIIL